jgi:hypothetical protein
MSLSVRRLQFKKNTKAMLSKLKRTVVCQIRFIFVPTNAHLSVPVDHCSYKSTVPGFAMMAVVLHIKSFDCS